MSGRIAQESADQPSAKDIKDPALGWIIGFLGLFSVVPLRKVLTQRRLIFLDL
jgi:hypothetical protein